MQPARGRVAAFRPPARLQCAMSPTCCCTGCAGRQAVCCSPPARPCASRVHIPQNDCGPHAVGASGAAAQGKMKKTRKPELIRELQLHPTVNRRVRFVIGGHSLLQKSKAIARQTRRPSATALSLVSSVSSSSRRAEPQPAQHYASRTQHPRSRRQHQWARRRQLDLPYDPSGEPGSTPNRLPSLHVMKQLFTRYRARFHRSDSDSLLTPTSPTGLRPSRMA